MKKFVMITETYHGIGGLQYYIADKVAFMASQGYQVFVFSPKVDNSLFPLFFSELQRFDYLENDFIMMFPQYFPRKQADFYLKTLVKNIDFQTDDDVLIESNYSSCALWGELLADKTNGKHYCFSVSEVFSDYIHVRSFFAFKFKRKELAGTVPQSLHKLFGNYLYISPKEEYILPATNSRVVFDYQSDFLANISWKDINLCSIGRINKIYIVHMVGQVKIFAKKHPEKSIMLLLICGPYSSDDKKRIQDLVVDEKNLSIIFAGTLSPIPKSLFLTVDVFLSSSTSAQISACNGVPTIAFDGNNGLAIGVLGYSTSHDLFLDSNDEVKSGAEWLEELIFGSFLQTHSFHPEWLWYFGQKDWRSLLAKHLVFVNESAQSHEYYNVFAHSWPKAKFYRFLIFILGYRLAKKVMFFNSIIENKLSFIKRKGELCK